MKKTVRALLLLAVCLAALLLATSCHKHEWSEWTVDVPATCTEPGFNIRVCACGDDELEEVPANGHTYGAWITDTEAGCTEDGSKHMICAVCEKTIKTDVIPAVGHTDGEWITDTEADCTEDGSKHMVCAVCEETLKTETIPAVGHTDGEWITDQKATCAADGTRHQICADCGETLKTETIKSTGKHVYVGRVTVEPTCTKGGLKTYTCPVCKDSYTKETAPAGHTQVTDAPRAASCTQTGLSAGQHCSTCGLVIIAQKESPKLEHNTQYGVCTLCGEVTDAHNALAAFIVNNGTLEDGVYYITNQIRKDGFLLGVALYYDSEDRILTGYLLLEDGDTEMQATIGMRKKSDVQEVATAISIGGSEGYLYGDIYRTTFSEDSMLIYNYDYENVTADSAAQLKTTFGETLHLLLISFEELILNYYDTGVTLSMLGYTHY